MIYYEIEKQGKEIILGEPHLDARFTEKTETVFAQCNGYIGVRASFETKLLKETRGAFITGLYHQSSKHEVSELINCPDVTQMNITINGEEFYLDTCHIKKFSRKLHVMTGELVTEVFFDLEKTKDIYLKSRRFASAKDRRFFVHEVECSIKDGGKLTIQTGINGQITNSGASHFEKVEARVHDKQIMYTKNSCEDGQELFVMTKAGFVEENTSSAFALKRRSIYGDYTVSLEKERSIHFLKCSCYNTEELSADLEEMQEATRTYFTKGYEALYQEHKEAFADFWEHGQIEIKGATLEEEACIAFALYHLYGMTPAYTDAYSVGAKGLTGEGYKGHVFWDTEIFVMPFFTAVFPEVARNLLKYRYRGLSGAKEKAVQYGYEGAMYPWETGKSGKEETPLFAALNIHTGKATKVWSGIKEHHVTADIIYALEDYYKLTKDIEFLQNYGYEMIFETAMFWYTRADFCEARNQYVIQDIIGPDEYTEHVDNNAYTNYMAYKNVNLAVTITKKLEEENGKDYQKWSQKYDLPLWKLKWEDYLEKLYLPQPQKDSIISERDFIIPQDDTFLSKALLMNIEQYKQSDVKQAVLLDYSREEVVNMQVLKQADVVMLLNLIPNLFDAETVRKNVEFYEKRTIHDSSLSYCAHSIACARIGDVPFAYEFFKKAMEIDLNDNYKDSSDGIHSASLGGIWNCIMQGFAGISHEEETIVIRPNLPKSWEELTFHYQIEGLYYEMHITDTQVEVIPLYGKIKKQQFEIAGKRYKIEKRTIVNL